jgi:hypothetical protein
MRHPACRIIPVRESLRRVSEANPPIFPYQAAGCLCLRKRSTLPRIAVPKVFQIGEQGQISTNWGLKYGSSAISCRAHFLNSSSACHTAIIAEIRPSAHPKVPHAAQECQRRPRRSSALPHSIGHHIAAAHNRKYHEVRRTQRPVRLTSIFMRQIHSLASVRDGPFQTRRRLQCGFSRIP